jgi:hypothetical protein
MFDPNNEVDVEEVVSEIESHEVDGDFDDEGVESLTSDIEMPEDVANALATMEKLEGLTDIREDYKVVVGELVDDNQVVTPAAAPVEVVKTLSKMDVARAIFNEEVEKAKPNKQVRKTVIDRFKAECGMGVAYAATAYQNLTKKNS